MKKLLLVLLGLSVTLAGCGSLSVKDKENLMALLIDIDEDDFKEKMDDAEYTEVEDEHFTYYVSADFIKKDEFSFEDLEEYTEYDHEGILYSFIHHEDQTSFIALNTKKVKGGYVTYTAYISEDEVKLRIVLKDEDGEEEVGAYYEYEDGELVLGGEDDSDEYEDLINDHEKKAVKFFDRAFKELDSVIN